MLLQVILEGLGLGALLALVCAVGIRKGAVGMVHLYSPAVQQRCVKLGLTTHEKIKRNSQLFKAVCIPGYIGYVLVCVYGINGAKGFAAGFWQLLVILSVMNPIDTDQHIADIAGDANGFENQRISLDFLVCCKSQLHAPLLHRRAVKMHHPNSPLADTHGTDQNQKSSQPKTFQNHL